MASEPKSCPMCGSAAELRFPFTFLGGKGTFPRCNVECTNADCRLQGRSSLDAEDAVLAWNRRVESPALTVEQRDAVSWAADRAHIASLGKSLLGSEYRRWRVLMGLANTVPKPDGQ